MIKPRAFVAQISIVGGKPDLQLPAGVEIVKEGPGLYHASWQGHTLALKKLGTISDDVVFAGVGTPQVLTALSHLGAKVVLLRTAWQNPTRKQWLLDHGVRELNNQPIAPHTFCGHNSIMVGNDHEEM